jgi:Zn-dependent metalloprotease
MSARLRASACIVPPDLLKRIVLEGDAAERESAIETLSLDLSLRQARAEIAGRRDAAPRPLGSLVDLGGVPSRVIHDLAHASTGVGAVARAEGQPVSVDAAINEAYEGLGATYAFFWKVCRRNSIDAAGLVLDALVHFGTNYNNALWDGDQMIFGDGDGILFSHFTASLDVIAHELMHGVTQYELNLVYAKQSGALNESLSDVMGSLVKQYARKETVETADWLIGADCVGPKLHSALRSLKAPGTANAYDKQPADMSGFVDTTEDHGGVHTNSGIPNRAFYLVATALGGYAWERAGRIWYESLRDPKLRSNSGFGSFANATVRQAGLLYGPDGSEVKAVREAWRSVKVL